MRHKNYEVWITCDGQSLPEYQTQVEGDQGKTIACFIPSESGKNFVIHWRDGVGVDSLNLIFTLDGNKLKHCSHCTARGTGQITGVFTTADMEQPFQFADLQTTDDDALLGGVYNQADLGTIEVGIKRVHRECRVIPFAPGTFDPVGAVHERSKKAGAHSVGLGKGTRVAGQPHQHLKVYTLIDPSEGFVAVFIFRYRSRALLQAQGVMPPPVSQPQAGPSQMVKTERKRVDHPADNPTAKRLKVEPDTAKVDLGVIELSDDEDSDLLQTRSRAQTKWNNGRVKKEPGTSARGGIGDSGDVIDLTLDD